MERSRLVYRWAILMYNVLTSKTELMRNYCLPCIANIVYYLFVYEWCAVQYTVGDAPWAGPELPIEMPSPCVQ